MSEDWTNYNLLWGVIHFTIQRYIHTYVYVYVYIYTICIYIYIYIYTYTYTYTYMTKNCGQHWQEKEPLEYLVCRGSSNQHPGDFLPWVMPVSDTLSAAYMPPAPPLLHPSLCAFSLFLILCNILSPPLSQDCFCPFLLSLSDSPGLCFFFFHVNKPPPSSCLQLAFFRPLLSLQPYPLPYLS